MFQTLVIEGEIPSLNEYINLERSNRYAAAAMKKRETMRIAMLCKSQKIKPSIISMAWFTYYHKNKKKDFDNVEAFQKFIWDGIVTAGIIPNDTQEYAPRNRIHTHKYDKEQPRLELRLFEGEVLDDSCLRPM